MVRPFNRHFSLMELHIVIAIIAILAAILVPALTLARRSALEADCRSNLRQIGLTFRLYANDNDDMIPPTFQSYTGKSIPVVKMYGGSIYALGRLIEDYRMKPEMFGCQANPTRNAAYVATAWQSGGVVQSAYLYREADCGFLPKLSSTANGGKAMLLDFSCLSPIVPPIVPHNYRNVNILYTDGSVECRKNTAQVNEFFTLYSPPGSASSTPSCDAAWQHADR